MSNSTVGLIGLGGFILVAVVLLIGSILFMTGESRRTAALNKAKGQPVSNGYATVTIAVVVVIFAITFFLGLLPPILRRG